MNSHTSFTSLDCALVSIQEIPYCHHDLPSSQTLLDCIMEVSSQTDLYDYETQLDFEQLPVHIAPKIATNSSASAVFEAAYDHTARALMDDNFLVTLGGSPTISIGVLRAYYEKYANLTVLHLGANPKVNQEVGGSKFHDACALYECSQHTNLLHVGIRSMNRQERSQLQAKQVYLVEDILDQDYWMEESLGKMTNQVYVILDMSVFDPAIVPFTACPDPNGMNYQLVIDYLRRVIRRKNVVGLTMLGFYPQADHQASKWLFTRLYCKILLYKFEKHLKEEIYEN